MSENQNPTPQDDILADENLLGNTRSTETQSETQIPDGKISTQNDTQTPSESSGISKDTLPWEDASSPAAPTFKNTAETVIPNGKIIDININSLEDVVNRIMEKEYDFVVIEPEESEVKLSFRKENIERSAVYIKYPVYTTLLFQIKQAAGLLVENTKDPQEGKGNINFNGKEYIIGAKTAPSSNGERIWMKPKPALSAEAKKAQKTPLSKIFAFFGAIFFVALVLGGTFITFVILNTNDVSDVRFFSNLGIRLQDINDFLSGIVTFIFSLLLFLFTVVLTISLFRFILTKKVLKKKKLGYGLFSAFMLILTFMTGVLWMTIDQKIKTFPNWGEGDLKIYDNTLKLSELGDDSIALLDSTQNLIGPVSLLFDLSNFETNRKNQGYTIQKYIWEINGDVQETFIPTLIYDFTQKGNYSINITAEMTDINNQANTEKIPNIPPIAINSMIETEINTTNNGGLKASFNASDLKNQGKVVWYFKEPVTESNPNPSYPDWTEVYEGYEFIARQIFFETTYVGIDIIGSENDTESIEKVIAINPNTNSEISGEISSTKSLSEDLEVEFSVKDPKTSFGNGFIEEFIWNIEGKTYSIKNTDLQSSQSPAIKHIFSSYGEQKVSVKLIDSKGNSETLSSSILLQKNVEIQNNLLISDKDDQVIEDYRYEKRSNEYFIDGLGVPATVKLDARMIRPVNPLYSLKEVLWDGKNDGNIDGKEKMFVFEIPTEGNHVVAVTYNFVHRKDPDTIISLKEFIYIEGVKKDAILSLKMDYESNYAPVNVRFDASESYIKNDNIIKFIYNYGDGIVEERDAINPSHLYSKAGDYTITLTVVGKSGKSYSTQRKLILLPPPQAVKISTSMKKAPVGQGIDFSSSESSGQIVEYFWNFGDGNTSTQANPTHSYKKPGIYKVSLKVNFDNKNSISDEVEIEIQ